MRKSHFLEAAEACFVNGQRLLDDVDWMIYPDRPAATCFVLATIAQEEFAKTFLLFLVDKGVISWNPFIYRATRDHSCKQLVGLVLKHLSPDDDDDSKRDNEFWARIKEHRHLIETYDNSSDQNETKQNLAKDTRDRERVGLPSAVRHGCYLHLAS